MSSGNRRLSLELVERPSAAPNFLPIDRFEPDRSASGGSGPTASASAPPSCRYDAISASACTVRQLRLVDAVPKTFFFPSASSSLERAWPPGRSR